MVANRLVRMQRGLLLCVTKFYATVSTDVLHVLSGVLPLDLRAELERSFTALVRCINCVDGTGLDSESFDLWRSTLRRKVLWWIGWTSELTLRTTFTYYGRINQDSSTVG